MKLYLIRHGETDANARGIVQGWLDTELNEKGTAQAIEAARQFNESIGAIYSSDLKRAVNTAKEFRARYQAIPYFEDSRLRERNFGDATGSPRESFNWDEFWSVSDHSTIANAEILDSFTQRVEAFLVELKTKPFSSVLIVTHAGVLNRVQTILDSNHRHYSHPNASILEIEI